LVGDAGKKPAHARQDAFVDHGFLLGWERLRFDGDMDFVAAAVGDQMGREGAFPSRNVARDIEGDEQASAHGAERQHRRPLDGEQFFVERNAAYRGACDVTGAVAQAERDKTGRKFRLGANPFVSLFVK
jgi:hypothetical protein